MKYNNKQITLVLVAAIVLLASCGKVYDLNGFDWEPDTPPSDSVYNREIQVLDLGRANLPAGHQSLDGQDPMYFSLEKFSSVHIGYKTSERWDVALSGWNAGGNNGSREGFGYGSSAIGGILLMDSAYSTVTTVPPDDQFVIPGNYGLDNVFGSGPGYATYTGFGNPFHPDMVEWANGNDPEKAYTGNLYLHMIYFLSENLANAYPGSNGGYVVHPKTIIVRTAKGNYAKLEMQSYYKGITNPKEMRRSAVSADPYLTFRYMVIKKDEKRFGFVARKPPLTVNLTTKKITTGN